MPHIGIKRHTPAIRMQRLKKLIIKEKVVFPKPLIMPRRTVLVYKNGQIQESVRIKLPASGLLNRKIPIHFPDISRKIQQKHPRNMQEQAIFEMIAWSLRFSFISWISATVGRSMEDTALVIAEGNRIQGSAIPVRTPYTCKDREEDIPEYWRKTGMDTASILCRMFNNTRLAVRGKACLKSLERWMQKVLAESKFCTCFEAVWCIEYRQ